MSGLKTPDQILENNNVNIDKLKDDNMYWNIRSSMDEFVDQYFSWKFNVMRANGDDQCTESASHKQNVSGGFSSKISFRKPNGNLFISMNNVDVIEVRDMHKDIDITKLAIIILEAVNNYR